MSALLSKFDLITAERISGYLKQRIYQLEIETPEHLIHYRNIIRELRELKIHIDGDLNSMLNDMEAGSYR